MKKVQAFRQEIISLTSLCTFQNPFLDVCITATFCGPEQQIIKREAYWNGDCEYCISFAPTMIGIWTYTIHAPLATGLNELRGELECIPYQGDLDIYKHGFIQVSENKHYFTYADGTPFFWLGDTHWEFAYRERWDESNHDTMTSMFKGMVDRRVEQGFTVYQTNLRSDVEMGGEQKYWCENEVPNIDFYKHELDRRMFYIADAGLVNAIGQAWFMAVKNNVEHQKHLARYLVARYGALPIIWTLAGETAGYTPGEEYENHVNEWRKVALYIENLDGYHSLQTAHYTNERPFAEYYQDEEWFDFTLNQAGHGDYPISAAHYRNFFHKHPNKPFVEGEALYEYCSTLEELGSRLCTDAMLRRVAYMSIQLGGCGYTYGAQGIWDCVWDKSSENKMKVFNLFHITWTEAIDAPGGYQMQYMKEFYLRHEFWKMHAYAGNPDNPLNPLGKKDPYITINEDESKLILYYAHNCRKPCCIEVKVDNCYHIQWFDPSCNVYKDAGMLETNHGVLTLPAKPTESDWLLVAEKV